MSGLAAGAGVALATGGLDAALASALAVAQTGSLTERALVGAARVLGVSVVAAGVAAAVALVYRWYVRERVPGSLPALFGLSAIVPLLGANQLLREVMDPTAGPVPLDELAALSNIAVFLVALAATRLGTAVGDRLGSDVAVATGERAVETEVSRVVQAVGRVITVELPGEVDDIVGYDPVPDETKETLAGKTFVFPRRLTVDELRDRLVTRLKADYGVGHVDLELADDGSVEYLAVGSRAAGIGPTLPPETSAVAVRADPAFAASAGDLVQVWRTDPFERVVTAELRGVVDDVATLAIDAADTRKLDAEGSYKLVTLPVETRPDREFASVLRAAEETMAAVTVGAGSELAGQPVGALDVTVVAVRPDSGPVEPLPGRDRALTPGDAVYVVAAPEAIRKVEAAATPRDGAGSDGPSATGAALSPEEQVDPGRPVAGEAVDGTANAASDPAAPGANGETSPSESRRNPIADADAPGIEALEAGEPDAPSNGDPTEEPAAVDDGGDPDDASAPVDDRTAEPPGTDEAVAERSGSSGDADAGDDRGDTEESPPSDGSEGLSESGSSEEPDEEGEPEAGDDEPETGADESESSGDGDAADDEDDGAEAVDESGGSDWTVAVDQRRDDEE